MTYGTRIIPWLKARGADWYFSLFFGLALVSASLGSQLLGLFTLILCVWSLVWLILNRQSIVPFSLFEKTATLVLISFFIAQKFSQYAIADADVVHAGGYPHYLLVIIPLYIHARQRVVTISSIVGFGLLAVAVALLSTLGQIIFTDSIRANMLLGGHEIMLGYFVLISTMLTIAAMIGRAQKPMHTAVIALVLVAGLFAVFLSGTRGAYIVVPLLLLLLVVGDYLINLQGQRVASLTMLSLVLALALVVAANFLASPKRQIYINRVESMLRTVAVASNGSVENKDIQGIGYADQSRLLMLAIGWQLFLEKPVFGHGLGSYANNKNRFVQNNQTLQHYSKVWKNYFLGFNQPHNEYVRFLSEQGLVGFFFVLLLLFGSLWWLWGALKHRGQVQKQTYALCALVVALAYIQFYATEGITSRSAMFSHQLVLLSVLISQVARLKRQEEQP